jgi:hypothetical protein
VIDPISIGLAFATAQSAVSHIKQAVALGKDVKGLIGEFSKFYLSADQIHTASSKKKMESIRKTNAQIAQESLQLSMASKALRVHERELKDILIFSGNGDVWEDMMAERVRLFKERAELERQEEERKKKQREALGNLFLHSLLFFAVVVVLFPIVAVFWQLFLLR